METIKIGGRNITFQCNKNNLQIIDSYKVSKPKEMKTILNYLRKYIKDKYKITYKRSVNSWCEEWQAHNLYYDLNQQRDRSRSVDLNEDEPKWKIQAYCVSAAVYRITVPFRKVR